MPKRSKKGTKKQKKQAKSKFDSLKTLRKGNHPNVKIRFFDKEISFSKWVQKNNPEENSSLGRFRGTSRCRIWCIRGRHCSLCFRRREWQLWLWDPRRRHAIRKEENKRSTERYQMVTTPRLSIWKASIPRSRFWARSSLLEK